ncbi:hypothetical protein PR001_g19753 [Phytophthora rubi]|uniref:Uncharacterized protein n=1 Tax=Phytophthora rubi TaxID=129364 RepID=A0A6A3JNJ1_9STRA|nr:hypothetical protein PR002_g20127 [Phytophthora rubi]KAE8996806.1 hypothetical protein PR001_g19753 [Phytophthora rubi]
MPRTKITWVLLARYLSLYYSDMLLESLKDYVVSKSGLSPCSLCTEATPHNMRTRLLLCKCKACKTVAPDARCPWKGMVQTCTLSNVVSISEASQHISPFHPPRQARLTEEMKAFARAMCTYSHKPMSIYNGIIRRFQVSEAAMTKLATVQCFVQHYRCAHIGGRDFLDDVEA